MIQTIGYKLINSLGTVEAQFGGTPGEVPGIPNPLILPNGVQVCAAELNTDYDGYTLVLWEEEVPRYVPPSITPRQARLVLLNAGLLDAVEAILAQLGRATQITWEYATELKRTDPLLLGMAAHPSINLNSEQVDDLFIAAAQII